MLTRALSLTCVLFLLSPVIRPGSGQESVSYHRDIAPLLKARCAGCHRPGKTKGGLDLTSVGAMMKGGRTGPAVVAKDPARSLLLDMVRGEEPEMPPEEPPLGAGEIAKLEGWIAAGAVDDTPAGTERTTAPRVYDVTPPNPALAYSPGGSLLAVAGHHEVLLHRADGRGLVARLIGSAPRIESITFSRDGAWLAAAGGAAGRFGEVQVWNVAERRLERAVRVTEDVLYGVSFSPDASRVAFGCADKTVRMISVANGAEILRFRSHADWVLGTCFTLDGKQLVSGGRDKALKIIDLADGRFVDDINNPLERVLGLARHPEEDTVLYGGDQGTPRLYRISDNQKRTAARRDTNLLKTLERQSGAIRAVAFSGDGARLVAGGADPVARIHETASGRVLARLTGHEGALFAAAFHPGGKQVATCGQDGVVRLHDADSGELEHSFTPVPLAAPAEADAGSGTFLVALHVEPPSLTISDANDHRRVLVTGRTADGRLVDLTRTAKLAAESEGVTVTNEGFVAPRAKGAARVSVTAGGLSTLVDVQVLDASRPPAHFIKDVMPIFSRVGCSAGGCHGSEEGQNGFALSLRGFDPDSDYRALVQELAGRRIDRVIPERSLLLAKPLAEIPHEGGRLIDPGSRYHRTLLDWVSQGAQRGDDETARVVALEVLPKAVELPRANDERELAVVARYADGSTRDVTRDAILESSNIEVATVDGTRITAARRGEGAVLVRYEGVYASAPVTVMGDRTGFEWAATEVHNEIDGHVHAKLKRVKALPSGLCTDDEFVRRIHVDLTGQPPTPEVARAFMEDATASRIKRERLIDDLIGSPAYVEHWANKWADLLQCQSRTLGEKGVWVFRRWLSQSVAENRPYDEFVHELLTAGGSTYDSASANYMRALTDKGQKPDPNKMAEDVSQTFLGVRFNCNRCHNHPFERWTQDQYYELAAHFARVRFKRGGRAGEMVVYDSYDGGETTHPRTSRVMEPRVPFAEDLAAGEDQRRDTLAVWLTSKENPLFARSYVNRVWSYLLGRGIIEPVDDIRAGNPPANPELLDWLENRFIDSGFDFNALVRVICRSATYQSTFRTNRWNADDAINFSHYVPRRLTAEQLHQAVAVATGVRPRVPGMPEGVSAAEAPDGMVKNDDFFQLFGRPKRDSACECARSNDLSLAHALRLVNGTNFHEAITAPRGRVAKIVAATSDDRAVVAELYWAALARAPTKQELDAFADLGEGAARVEAAQDLMWALINSPAFLFNR